MDNCSKKYLNSYESDFVSINCGSYFQTRYGNGNFLSVEIPVPKPPIELGDLTPIKENVYYIIKTNERGVHFELNLTII
ncbi:MAG: hypothetical protein ABIF85_00580 [Nanoarchaeota archaeon]|nr:hypothetical protein [Nanoarchaeota archaeon]MBU4451809.1 hypothetical protein [Nanoarchaeota archaeon]MCG2723462.1 hypothetical protein [archaeon]